MSQEESDSPAAVPWQECTAAGAQYPYVLVMERGDRSLHHFLSSERIAGFACEAIKHIIRRVVTLALTLHSKGLAHNDLKVKRLFISLLKKHVYQDLNVLSSMVSIFYIWCLCVPEVSGPALVNKRFQPSLLTPPPRFYGGTVFVKHAMVY